MAKLRLGSDEHKKLFCGEFIDTFHPFEVRDLKWPELSEANLQRVRSMPFWSEAVTTERTAGLRVKLMAVAETDPVIREAIALQAYEESRHAQMLEALLRTYGMKVPEGGGEARRDIEWGFIRMGYGEEFDSFFAFGLFKLAGDTGLFPAPLLELFDRVMQEEARHILFFSNWVKYRAINLRSDRRVWFALRRAMALSSQVLKRVRTALNIREEGGKRDDFIIEATDALDIDISIRQLLETCLVENDRRLASYDERLPRPYLVPRLSRLGLSFMPKVIRKEPQSSAP
jgi:hypothetical protein